MERVTKDKLTQAIKHHTEFLKKLDDRLEESKKRKKEIEDETRERRRKVTF